MRIESKIIVQCERIIGNLSGNLFLEFYRENLDKVMTQVQEYARTPRLVSFPSSKAYYTCTY